MGILTPEGFDPNGGLIPPTVPMSSAGVTVRGPQVHRTLAGELEQGAPARIDAALALHEQALRDEAEAKIAQNEIDNKRRMREAEIERQSMDRLAAENVAREADRQKRESQYDAEVRKFEDKHGGDQSYGAKHGVGDALVNAVAVALGGIGMAIARRPGENPALNVVNNKISTWYADQQNELERDREKLARSKVSIEDQSKYYDRRKLQIDAEKQALLLRTAKEFDAQAALAKNPEVKAAALEGAAKARDNAEKQREFVMKGQQVSYEDASTTANRTNSGPSTSWSGTPKTPAVPTIPGTPAAIQPAPATAPIPGAVPPVPGAPIAPNATPAQPLARMPVNATAGATDPGDALAKLKAAASATLATNGVAATSAKPAVNPAQLKAPTAPTAPKLPTPTKDGVIADAGDGTTDLSKVDKRTLAASGPIYGHQGKIIALIADKKLAEATNLRASSMKHYSENIIKAKSAADEYKKAMDAAGIGEVQALALSKLQDSEGMLAAKKFGGQRLVEAKQRFLQSMKNVRGSAKGAVATDAMSDSEAAVAMPISDIDVYFGTYGTTANEALSSGAERVKSIYASVGLNPDSAFNGLVGKGSKPPSAAPSAPQSQSNPAQSAPDPAMVSRAQEAAKDPGPRGQRAREWLQQNGAR